MKAHRRSIRFFPLFLAVGGLLLFSTAGDLQKPAEDSWSKVDQAVEKGRPKTAIELLEPMIAHALEQGAHAEAIRALARKVTLEGTIQGNKAEERIVRFEAEMETMPAEIQPLMHAVLAHWYWQYFQQNRWRFLQRTATAQAPGDDITTWDLTRLFAEIDTQFSTALESREQLLEIPIQDYDGFLIAGTLPDSYRPTLYDFIANQALEFYSSGEQAGAQPQNAFVLSAEPDLFAPAVDFLEWDIPTTDPDAALYKGLRLYQELLAFHLERGNTDALLDADLSRLRFGYNHAVGEEKNALTIEALHQWIGKWNEHGLSARAHHDLATVFKEEGKLVQARETAWRGHEAFPDSLHGNLCFNLVQDIERPEVSMEVERVWNASQPDLQITYKNLTEVHFRLVPWDWEKMLSEDPDRHPEQSYPDDRFLKRILSADPARAWTDELPATDDFQLRTERLQPPENLKPGFYWLVSAHEPDFNRKDSPVSIARVWVSDLAIVWRQDQQGKTFQGLVLDAQNGSPVDGATVRFWRSARTWNDVPLRELPAVRTDELGLFQMEPEEEANQQYIVLVESGEQRLAVDDGLRVWSYGQDQKETRTVFFTDRAIYRPGQTIHFKGIHLRLDQQADTYQTLANRTFSITFRDVNHEEIARQQVTTNDYGSFSGTFTAPRDRLTGYMTIQHGGRGQTGFRVEEYKRPTFRVELDAPEDPARLGETVQLTGTARAYTGAPTDGAQVRWRVVRDTRYPTWWTWSRWWFPRGGESQEIAHGLAETGVDGTFQLEFTARPDPAAEAEGNPTFPFTVFADVTDAAGETRSTQRRVNVGFTALNATVTVPDWLEQGRPFEIKLRTTSLDGEGRAAEGSLSIYSLEEPETVHRVPLQSHRHYGVSRREAEPDLSNPNTWALNEKIREWDFTTGADGNALQQVSLPVGAYRAVVETEDAFGNPVRSEAPLQVMDPAADRLAIRVPHLFKGPRWSVEPGETFTALWGSGYPSARAFVEVEHRGEVLQSYWTEPGTSQIQISQPVGEHLRGGFQVRVTFVHENRAYLESRHVEVPWNNKKLELTWERFTSKLKPGQEETWTAVIRGRDAQQTAAEMVATLYDASLDAFQPHRWMDRFHVFRQDTARIHSDFENTLLPLQSVRGRWKVVRRPALLAYRTFPVELTSPLWGARRMHRDGVFDSFDDRDARRGMVMEAAEALPIAASAPSDMALGVGGDAEGGWRKRGADAEPGLSPIQLDDVSARENLNETAFFFPHVVSKEDGTVRMEFTIPEALTEWNFLGFAHDTDLRSGLLKGTTVTAKELMIQPNPPRFLREGDVLEFTVRVTNQSEESQQGMVRLNFSDARTLESRDEALSNTENEKPFDVPAKQSRTLSWRIEVPDQPGILLYRAVGSTGKLSDGEEAYLPVLSRRILVTESIQLPIRGPETKEITFDKLLASGEQESLENKTLTLQMVSNPAWYAVLALPTLMEYPHQCAEQVFNRFYANQLAGYIANADPKIRRVFDQWKNTDTLDSPLEKNEDLKSVVLEETPWVRQAQSESRARKNLGMLFDENRLNSEVGRAAHQLEQMQYANGSWPWFPGGRPNDYITLYITTGFSRLRHLGVETDLAPAIRSLGYLDGWMHDRYLEAFKRTDPKRYVPSPMISMYLYTRTFLLEDQEIDRKHCKAFDFFVERAKENWVEVGNRKSQGHLALALHRLGEEKAAQEILISLKERSVTDEELGMFWRDLELSWWWYRAPIETQALMIEAFGEVMSDQQAVEECRVWLLKQKQTQDWKTTKATADAVYGLLLRGADLLASDELVDVTLGEVEIQPENVEAGTGFYEKRFVGPEIVPDMGRVTITKKDEGVAWGGLHWQYLEDIANITPHDGTPLQVEKRLYIKRNTAEGPVLEEVDGPVGAGDEVVSRIVLRTDRDMEYVHLKETRGSGTEPVNVLSGYRYQDGLRYYESTRDTASHFFIDYLPKGIYVFETSVRVQHRGKYQTGMAEVQCMYAPEFNSHSGSQLLEVK